jgi:RNA polymerase sigma factor (sigma-70 family)
MIAVVRDDPAVVDLVVRARHGDKTAWDAIVERYAPLVWAACRRHGLAGPDADDVGASVWLRLVENLDKLREPAALPGWLATTARRECLHFLNERKRQIPIEELDLPAGAGPTTDEWLLVEERRAALRLAFAGLQERCQRLLSMLFSDPPTPYAEIGATLEMAIGAIGPNRKRCLDRLRRSRALRYLVDASPPVPEPGLPT